jgi:hypothetical protein
LVLLGPGAHLRPTVLLLLLALWLLNDATTLLTLLLTV